MVELHASSAFLMPMPMPTPMPTPIRAPVATSLTPVNRFRVGFEEKMRLTANAPCVTNDAGVVTPAL